MILEKIMSKPVVTVELNDSLRTVKEIFDSSSFHHLLVEEHGELFGVISDRDLLRAISPHIGTLLETNRDAATLNKRVHQIMTRKPVTLRRSADVFEAIELFNRHTISCIPITDTENRIEGIVSWRDIFRLLEANRQRLHPQENH
ncbi:MAG: CBS domain-containing protein [Gammaproteobacteria bacterium]|nr:CBS domain-containing protein [Gammaproteobacteria bacterium]MDP2346448.1 CBS domain-containing protein [Gammaproteobacteria bacterium]